MAWHRASASGFTARIGLYECGNACVAWIDQPDAEREWLRRLGADGRLSTSSNHFQPRPPISGSGLLLACGEIELLATNGRQLGVLGGTGPRRLTYLGSSSPSTFTLTLDGSQTEVYRGSAGTFTWWEGATR